MSRWGKNAGKKPPDIGLQMECHEEALTPEQAEAYNKGEKEFKEIQTKLEEIMKSNGAQIIEKGENVYVVQMAASPPAPVPTVTAPTPIAPKIVGGPQPIRPTFIAQPPPAAKTMVQPVPSAPAPVILQGSQTVQTRSTVQTRTGTMRGNTTPVAPKPSQPVNKINMVSNTPSPTPTVPSLRIKPPKPPNEKIAPKQSVTGTNKGSSPANRPTEGNSVGGLSTGPGSKPWRPTAVGSVAPIVDLTDDDGKPSNANVADSREVTFNKLSGKTFPSLVVAARPHLRIKDMAQSTVSQERAALGRRGTRGNYNSPETDAKPFSRSKAKAEKRRKRREEQVEIRRATRSQVKEEPSEVKEEPPEVKDEPEEPEHETYVVEMVGRQSVRFGKESGWHQRRRARDEALAKQKAQKRSASGGQIGGKQKKIRIIEPQAPPSVCLEKKATKTRKRRSK